MKTRRVAPRTTTLFRVLVLTAVMLPGSHGAPILSAGGNWAVGCRTDPSPDRSCDNGVLRGFAGGTNIRSANDSIFVQYDFIDGIVNGGSASGNITMSAQFSASASASAARASAFTGVTLAPIYLDPNTPALSLRNPTALAGADFGDTLTIQGPQDVRRTIRIGGHFSGQLGSTSGIAPQPGGAVNIDGSNATATLGTRISVNTGTGVLFPIVTSQQNFVFSSGLGDSDLTPNNSFEFVIDVAGGNIIETFGHLQVFASVNGFSNFGSTAAIDYILAPDDITIFSELGELIRSGDRFVYAGNTPIDPPSQGTVPVPGTALLLLSGLAALLATKRHRKRVTRARSAQTRF